jgi:hypothetical protein
MLEPGDRFARPCMPWEIPAQVPEQEKCNITIVWKMTDEMRTHRYVRIRVLDLTKPRIIDLGGEENSCLLCGAPAACTAFCVSDEIDGQYFHTGGTPLRREYALRQSCFELPDKVEKIEKELGII